MSIEKHHPFSPSSLQRLSDCPGAYKLCKDIPEPPESEDAFEGQAMHKVIEVMITGEPCVIYDKFDSEQKSVIDTTLEYLRGLSGKDWQPEQKMSLLDGFDLLTDGRIDLHCELDDRVIGVDLKFGRSEVPAVKENKQAVFYSAMLIQKYGKPVEFHIVQPRLHNYGNYTFELSELPNFIREFYAIKERCLKPGLELIPSKSSCMYCKAQHICPAIREIVSGGELAKVEHCHELSTGAIGSYLTEWKLIKKIGESLENQARERLIKGEFIPGWEIRTVRGNTSVKDAQGLYNAIKEFVPLDKFLDTIKVPIGDLTELYVTARQEAELLCGRKVTAKQCREEFCELIAPFSERESDKKQLQKAKGE